MVADMYVVRIPNRSSDTPGIIAAMTATNRKDSKMRAAVAMARFLPGAIENNPSGSREMRNTATAKYATVVAFLSRVDLEWPAAGSWSAIRPGAAALAN